MADKGSLKGIVSKVERAICFGALALLACIPFADLVLGWFNMAVPYSRSLMIHLFLVLVFFAAMLTASSKGHIAITVVQYMRNRTLIAGIELAGTLLAVLLLTHLAWNTLPYIRFGIVGMVPVGRIPIWVFALAMPLGYSVVAFRFMRGLDSGRKRALAVSAMLIGTAISLPAIGKLIWGIDPLAVPEPFAGWMDFLYDSAVDLQLPAIFLLILAALSGMPIFAAIGGIATVMLMAGGQEPEAFHIPVFSTLVSPDLIAIPLFTLTGFFLSESRAGERLVRTFRVFFSWLPGGIVIVAVLISAFFSSFTGASGITILALGGILFTIFRQNGYSERTSIGLLTAAGGTGVMFPPSLAIILVFSTSSLILHYMNVPMEYTVIHYFAGTLIPGILLLLATIASGIFLSSSRFAGLRVRPEVAAAEKATFGKGQGLDSLKDAGFELLLPLLLVVGFFTGRLRLLEASAVSVIYVVVVEVFIKKDIALRNIHKVFAKAIPVVGGVLIILAMAGGLSYAFVFSGIPESFASWMEATVQSSTVFLLLLNFALLLVGCVVDMFSAIMVLLPLVVPLGQVYEIDPLHLGVVFILNLEAGFLTPPVGINLFLASSRFEQPLMRVCRYILPFFILRIAVLLLVVYIPSLSLWLPGLIK
ncbi:MAG: TRAP transporter large permease subunit [Treponema sp.]|nr:TRAP transporter large permease subunit [Treponema sp.]